MASTKALPSFLLPRAVPKLPRPYTPLHPQLRGTSAQPCTSHRCASSSSKKPRVLEKPDKFRPPSHPARRVLPPNAQPRNYPGPPLSAEEIEAQKTKRYPNMFPPEGTVMHKFLTNRGIHVWISLSVLFSLAAFTYTTNFKATSPFAHLLPSWGSLLSHPIDTIGQFFSVMKMHADHITLETTEKRKRNVDDVQKRKEYRIAHGLEKREGESDVDTNSPQAVDVVEGEAVATSTPGSSRVEDAYVQREERRRPVKKWLGIW